MSTTRFTGGVAVLTDNTYVNTLRLTAAYFTIQSTSQCILAAMTKAHSMLIDRTVMEKIREEPG